GERGGGGGGARGGPLFRFGRPAGDGAELREPARAALARAGLAHRADALVANLSHGEHRQLEIAVALATSPRMLLLDEPMAGMGPGETGAMGEALRRHRRDAH